MKASPTISQKAFFALPAVQAQQAIQKRNAYGTTAHHNAYNQICELAKTYGAENYIKPEDY